MIRNETYVIGDLQEQQHFTSKIESISTFKKQCNQLTQQKGAKSDCAIALSGSNAEMRHIKRGAL
jgi:hypothetical protein